MSWPFVPVSFGSEERLSFGPAPGPYRFSLLEEQGLANNVKEFVGDGQTPVGIGRDKDSSGKTKSTLCARSLGSARRS